ncbi:MULTISPECIES: hypothetical protein [Catenuloplanes]|uniref:Uncharacterized protein n=1 Tax=Catenuloplanes niger TaxID=587534 RepID=A0AAE4CWQ5_9ACTN|nr:hypothetical protein [Catenuloplanes niger]MDR7327445.1 hypothetical protein [Catenuloplanes niger]
MTKRVWIGILVALGMVALVTQMALAFKPIGDLYTSGVLDPRRPPSSAGPAEAGPAVPKGSCFVGGDGEVRLSTAGEGTYWCAYPPEHAGEGQHLSAGLSLVTASTCGILQFSRTGGSGYAAVVCQSKVTLLDLSRQKAVDFRPVDSLEVGSTHRVALAQTGGRVTVELDGEPLLTGATSVASSGDGVVGLGVTRSGAGPVHAAFTDVTIDPYG